MYLAVMVGKVVKQVVREWCPSTTGPLLPPMTDSVLAPGREVLCKRYHTGDLVEAAVLGLSTEAPKPGTATRAFALNGLGILCQEMCYRRFTTLSRAPNCVSTNTSVRTVFFKDLIVRWTRGMGWDGSVSNTCQAHSQADYSSAGRVAGCPALDSEPHKPPQTQSETGAVKFPHAS